MGLALTLDDKMALYQNCTIFDEPDIYGGPVCGSNGVTYANSFYLDCKNHHSREIGKLIFSFNFLENIEIFNIIIFKLRFKNKNVSVKYATNFFNYNINLYILTEINDNNNIDRNDIDHVNF